VSPPPIPPTSSAEELQRRSAPTLPTLSPLPMLPTPGAGRSAPKGVPESSTSVLGDWRLKTGQLAWRLRPPRLIGERGLMKFWPYPPWLQWCGNDMPRTFGAANALSDSHMSLKCLGPGRRAAYAAPAAYAAEAAWLSLYAIAGAAGAPRGSIPGINIGSAGGVRNRLLRAAATASDARHQGSALARVGWNCGRKSTLEGGAPSAATTDGPRP